jgi:3-oxoadipate enol-lactonase
LNYTREVRPRAYRRTARRNRRVQGLRPCAGNINGMAVLELPDLSLWYERFGATDEAPRLLVFNGSGATIEASKPLIDQLAKHFDVLVHDQRCLGRTGLPTRQPTPQPTMADYAADALALVDHVGWDRFAVFGISFGGMVAQEFAVRHAERISRLALLCTSPGGAGGSSYPLHTLADLPAAEREAISLRNLDRRYDEAFLAEHPFDRMIVDGMRARASEVKLRGERMQLEARGHHDVWDRLHLVTCPTLVACGAYDGTAPPENSEAIHSRIAGSELRRYEGGHLFAHQDRRALPEIVAFLSN